MSHRGVRQPCRGSGRQAGVACWRWRGQGYLSLRHIVERSDEGLPYLWDRHGGQWVLNETRSAGRFALHPSPHSV